MRVTRFMSRAEWDALCSGKKICNNRKHDAKTTSVGFCFAEDEPQVAWKYLSGVVDADPRFAKAYIDAVRVFLDGQEDRYGKYRDEYTYFYSRYFCPTAEDYRNFLNQLDGNNLFADKIDIKKFLEEYYKIEL